MKFMIQSQNDPIDRLEAQIDHLKNSMNEQILKFSNILDILTNFIGIKNHGVLKTLNKIQFQHINLNLTNPKPQMN